MRRRNYGGFDANYLRLGRRHVGAQLLGVAAADVYVLPMSGVEVNVLAVPKAGGVSRVVAELPKKDPGVNVTQPVISSDSAPSVYYVDVQRAGQGGANRNADRVVAHEPGGGERDLTNTVVPKALTIDGDRLLFVSGRESSASLRELRR